MRKNIVFILLLFPLFVLGQNVSHQVNKGNKLYEKGKLNEAELEYKKALQKNDKSFEANSNLAHTFFKQKKYSSALSQYEKALSLTTDKQKKSIQQHNIGNCLMSNNKLDEAIEFYKQALRNNPKDDATRYNLVFAMSKRKQQKKQQKQNKNEKQPKKQDKKKDKKQKQNQDNQNNQNQPKQNKKQQEQKANAKPKMSKNSAEKLLKALQKDEKKTQDKAKKRQMNYRKQRVEKDW